MKYLFNIILFLFFAGSVSGQQNAQQNQIQTQSNLAIQYYNARDYEKAAPSLWNVYELSKNSTYFRYYLDCLIQLKRFDEAIRQIQQEIKKQKPAKPEYYIHWGYVLKMQAKTDENRAKYEEAIALIPANKNEYMIAANAFLGWQEYEYAKNTYLKGEQALGPGQFDYELARAYSYVRDYPNMMERYLDLLKQSEQQLPRVESSLASAMRLDIDDEILESFREQVLKRIQASPDVIGYNRLLIWLFLQEGKFSSALRQSIALDRRTGTEDAQITQLGQMALNNKKYSDALSAFDYLIGKGKENPYYALSVSAKIHTAYFQFINENAGNKAEGEKLAQYFNEALGFLGITPANLYLVQEYAHLLAFYLNRTTDAVSLINKAIEIPRLEPEEWGRLKTELADIYVFADDPWEATLLYSQVIDANKNNTLGDDAKLKKAKLGYYMGNFSWAKAQLDVLKASTSKLTANDAMELSLLIGNNLNLDTTAAPLQMFARADLLFFQNKNEQAIATLDSLAGIYSYHSLVDDVLFRKAKIEIEKKNYAVAAEQLQKIVDGFGYDLLGDDATFMLAELFNFNLNKKEQAKELYKSMLANYPGSVFTDESREKYRELRAVYPDKVEKPTPEEQFMEVFPTMKPTNKALFFAGLAVFFWSTVATAFKLALAEYDFIQLIFYTSAVTVILLFFVLLAQKKAGQIFRQTPRQWLNSAFMGAFNPLLYYLVLFKAYSLLPAQVAQPVNMIWPVTLALLSVPLLKQKISWLNFVALLISFSGVVVIASQGGTDGFRNTNPLGLALAVGSSVLWSLYWILNVIDRRDEVVKLFLNFAFGLVFLIPVVYFFSDFGITAGAGVWAMVYVGIFEVGITYVLWMKAMNLSTNNAKIGNLVFFAPFLSLVFIHFILKETIYFTTFIGLLLIVAGVLVQQLKRKEINSDSKTINLN